ncbi:hypothetical protein HOF92_00360 [bacterium]|nr:hypothetical protein [bacterium]
MNRFYDFLSREIDLDSDFVAREIHYMTANCSQEGLNFQVPMHPLFIENELVHRYERFGVLVRQVLEDILSVISDSSHEFCSEFRQVLSFDDEIDGLFQCSPKGRFGPGIIRPDTVVVGDGFKAHEFNVSWPGGICDSDIISKVLNSNSLYQKFRTEMEVNGIQFFDRGVNPTVKLLGKELCENSGMERPHIGLIHPRPTSPFGESDVLLHQYIQRALLEEGYDVSFLFPDQFEYQGGKPKFEGKAIDVVYRFFEWFHVVGDPGFLGYRRILEAWKEGDVPVVNAFISESLSAKSVFEILWDEEYRGCFAQEVLDEIREHIPRTFNLSKAAPEDLDLLMETRDSWVVKPVKGSCGKEVFLGKLVPDSGFWGEILHQGARNGAMVAQEFVETPEMVVCELEMQNIVEATHYLDLNPFYIQGEMGNFFARWSHTYMTAQCGPGMGGMYPVVTCSGDASA